MRAAAELELFAYLKLFAGTCTFFRVAAARAPPADRGEAGEHGGARWVEQPRGRWDDLQRRAERRLRIPLGRRRTRAQQLLLLLQLRLRGARARPSPHLCGVRQLQRRGRTTTIGLASVALDLTEPHSRIARDLASLVLAKPGGAIPT